MTDTVTENTDTGTGMGYFKAHTKEEIFETKSPPEGFDLFIEEAQKGLLTKEKFSTFFGHQSWSLARMGCRNWYRRQVGFAIITVEFLDSLAGFLKGEGAVKVVEVCAGKGFLQAPMRERGFDWICTDIDPVDSNVLKMDAIDAVKELKPDFVFASWIPYTSELDYELACLGVPMVIIGEGGGGCTGSMKFWGEYPWNAEEEDEEAKEEIVTPYEICRMPEDFQDVPVWEGLHDHTYWVSPI